MLAKYANELEEINSNIIEISTSIQESNEIILKALEKCDVVLLNDAKSYLSNTANKTAVIDNKIVKVLALFTPEATDLRHIISFFKVTNELQRASSNTKTYIKNFEPFCKSIDKKYVKEYAIPLQKTTIKCLNSINQMLKSDDPDEVREYFNDLLLYEKQTDDLYSTFEDFMIKNDNASENFTQYKEFLSALRKSKKIADRSADIAYLIIFAKVGGILGEVE
jgi:phosphate transport system protein